MLRPVLPKPLALPFSLLPDAIHSRVLVTVLNRVLAELIADGELDLLEGRTLGVHVKDANTRYLLSLRGGRLVPGTAPADVTMSGNVHAFLLMLTRREDPDTLFFQQRLSIEGDTALGLGVKNLLDALDWDSLPLPASLETALNRTLDMYERLFG